MSTWHCNSVIASCFSRKQLIKLGCSTNKQHTVDAKIPENKNCQVKNFQKIETSPFVNCTLYVLHDHIWPAQNLKTWLRDVEIKSYFKTNSAMELLLPELLQLWIKAAKLARKFFPNRLSHHHQSSSSSSSNLHAMEPLSSSGALLTTAETWHSRSMQKNTQKKPFPFGDLKNYPETWRKPGKSAAKCIKTF